MLHCSSGQLPKHPGEQQEHQVLSQWLQSQGATQKWLIHLCCVLGLLGEDAPHSPVTGHFHGHWEIVAGSTMKMKAAQALSLGAASNHQEDKGNAAFPKDSFSQPTLALSSADFQWFWLGHSPEHDQMRCSFLNMTAQRQDAAMRQETLCTRSFLSDSQCFLLKWFTSVPLSVNHC